MKFYFFCYATLLLCGRSFAQISKPPIDNAVYDKWPALGSREISDNGHFVMCQVQDNINGNADLYLSSSNNSWRKVIKNSSRFYFISNRQAIYKQGDSLVIAHLGSDKINVIKNVNEYELNKLTSIVLFSLKDGNDLYVRSTVTGKTKIFTQVQSYFLSNTGKNLIVVTKSVDGFNKLKWIDLSSGLENVIWIGTGAHSFVFDKQEKQLAFIAPNVSSSTELQVWNCKKSNQKAEVISVDPEFARMKYYLAEGPISFNKGGTMIYCKIKNMDPPKPDENAVKVDVWSFNDVVLQSQQLKGKKAIVFQAIIDVEKHHVLRLQNDNEEFVEFNGRNDDLTFVIGRECPRMERWNKACDPTFSLLFNNSGQRLPMEMEVVNRSEGISPNGKMLILTDKQGKDFFSYEISSGHIINITKDLPVPLGDIYSNNINNASYTESRGFRLAAWFNDGSAILIYDKFDIWQIDPLGKKAAICLTESFGRRNKIGFRFAQFDGLKIVFKGQKIILNAFNFKTKQNGFYSLLLNGKGSLTFISMDNCAYRVLYGHVDAEGEDILKAKNADVYLVTRMTSSRFPNYFVSKDLKKFTPITDIHPEEEYNWQTTELHSWVSALKDSLQGILYKPQNFNPGKKYPVIFYIYEDLSNALNVYNSPIPSDATLNISWYVSNGYLVFAPDIVYHLGETGESASSSVISAVKYLSTLKFVDINKIGIQGASFGGYETNYIITHTNIFTAACSSVGGSDFMSYYGTIDASEGYSQQGNVGEGQYRLLSTPWSQPERFIKNSPIFNAHHLTTPLLMMETYVDGAVPPTQSYEFITALRRLGKRSWLLMYEEGKHGLTGNSSLDFTMRMQQYFDFYLRNKAAPLWMLDGIPAKLKGFKSGLELDRSGRKPGTGILNLKEQEKSDSLTNSKQVTVTF